MTGRKAPKRKYDSKKRRAQARLTRTQIQEAAKQLFAEYGYSGATVEMIAREAGVATETIYAVFGNKRALLAKLIDESVGGNDRPVPLMQQPGPQAVLLERDPTRRMSLFVHDITNILERVAPIFEIMRAAAKTEPEIADLMTHLLDERLQNLALFTGRLAEHRSLRKGLDEQHAAETVWALTSPDLYTLLTTHRGWSKDKYARWLSDSLTRLLYP